MVGQKFVSISYFFIGTALTDHEMSSLHCEKITSLQRAAFKHLRDDLLDFCMGNVASVDKRESLTKLLGVLRFIFLFVLFSEETLRAMFVAIFLFPSVTLCYLPIVFIV